LLISLFKSRDIDDSAQRSVAIEFRLQLLGYGEIFFAKPARQRRCRLNTPVGTHTKMPLVSGL
jgi:hypothetical protein